MQLVSHLYDSPMGFLSILADDLRIYRLSGYSGGLARKNWLPGHENRHAHDVMDLVLKHTRFQPVGHLISL